MICKIQPFVMKRFYIYVLSLALLSFAPFSNQKSKQSNFSDAIDGAWGTEFGGKDFILLIQDGYCMFSEFNLTEKKFGFSSGGHFSLSNDKIIVKTEFNSMEKTDVGQMHEYAYTLSGNTLTTNSQGVELRWNRIDAGSGNLAGNWRITKRKQNENLIDIPLSSRRTLKLLTSTRFQWAAINIETGEFFGTGGGTYSFEDGVYKENIEFFSRDSTRVGMSLTFNDSLENGQWIHTGKSSKGDPIYEVWEK